MLTHRLLRGCYAAATSAALCIFLPSGTQAQDILRELEDAEPEQGHGHSHDHTDAPDTKKKDAPKAHQGHAGHKQTAKGKHASKQHQRHSDHGRTVPHDATHSGVQMHGVAHGMHGFLGPIRYSGKGRVQAGCQMRRRTSVSMPSTASGRPCITRSSTSCTTSRVVRAAPTRRS